MDLRQIEREWRLKDGDVAAEVAAWDATAEEYVFEEKNNFSDDPFLRFMAQHVELAPDMRTLDVGCGAGAFSVALAGRVGQADGVDLSPRMIELGRRYCDEHGVGNVSLAVRNWHDCDGAEFAGRYDVVFAHTTPAVADVATLRKMCDASRRHCLLCTTARRTDAVFDECKRLAGIEGWDHDEHVAYTFEALWLMGYNPEVAYAPITWLPDKPLDEARAWFIGRLRARGPLDEDVEARIDDYLRSVADADGIVHERIETRLANFYWQVC